MTTTSHSASLSANAVSIKFFVTTSTLSAVFLSMKSEISEKITDVEKEDVKNVVDGALDGELDGELDGALDETLDVTAVSILALDGIVDKVGGDEGDADGSSVGDAEGEEL